MAKILIIDDEIDICEMIESFFSGRGYKVISSVTGQGGLDAFSIEKPHIVMLDLYLKDMYGLEVLRKIKSVDPSCIVIIITGSAAEADRGEAMKSGADYYICKPFSIARLRNLLSRLE